MHIKPWIVGCNTGCGRLQMCTGNVQWHIDCRMQGIEQQSDLFTTATARLYQVTITAYKGLDILRMFLKQRYFGTRWVILWLLTDRIKQTRAFFIIKILGRYTARQRTEAVNNFAVKVGRLRRLVIKPVVCNGCLCHGGLPLSHQYNYS